MTTTNTQSFYSTMSNQNDSLFYDEEIQRFDADTIKNRYGDNWKSFASNVREITQPDGSIVKEYIIEDPSLLEDIKTPSRPIDSTSSTTGSDDEQQQSSKNKFAQLKAKFEQKNVSHVMASPATSAAASSHTTPRQNSNKQMDDLYARHRRASNELIQLNQDDYPIHSTQKTPDNNYHRSQSSGREKSKTSSFRRFESADEADDEVRRIHRQGEEFRRYNQRLSPMSSVTEISQQQQQSHVQYEVVDEDGNPMAIDGVHDLIKMSGVHAREVPQADGTIVKEYVIDNPQVLSKFRSQQQSQSPMSSSYNQQRMIDEHAPPPPPRIPLRQPILFRQTPFINDNLPCNIQQINVLEPQRRYEYLTTNGRRIQFIITNSDGSNGQLLNDSDLRELTNAINTRLLPSSSNFIAQQPSTQSTLPKPWYPSVDLAHRPPSNRQRIGSDSQSYPDNNNIGFQQIQTDLPRSVSYGALHQQPVFNEPINGWNAYRQQNSYNHQIDPTTSRQITNQRDQNNNDNNKFQTSAQFLPQQTSRSTHSPPVSFQQSYPYQGQQQHGVRILNNYDLNQQQTTIKPDGRIRI